MIGWPEQTDDLKRYYPGHVMETGAEIIFFSVEDAPAWAIWEWPWTVRPERLFELL